MNQQPSEPVEKGNSESGDSGVGGAASADAADVCRDFLRHVCKRGRRCRYRHPEASPPAASATAVMAATVSTATEAAQALVFCHDYQNGGCQRPSCRFVHCSREEEIAFRTTGRLPDRLLLALGCGDSAAAFCPPEEQPPVCKDHLKGECKRGTRCRFRHLDAVTSAAAPTLTLDFLTALDPTTLLMLGGGAGAVKRRRLEFEPPQMPPVPQPPPPPALPQPQLPPLQLPFSFLAPGPALVVDALQAENALLKRRLEELRKQCSDLMSTNEMLADQNARLRQQLQQPQHQHQHHQPQTSQLDVLSGIPGYSDLAYSGALFTFPQAAAQAATVVTPTGMKTLSAQLQ